LKENSNRQNVKLNIDNRLMKINVSQIMTRLH